MVKDKTSQPKLVTTEFLRYYALDGAFTLAACLSLARVGGLAVAIGMIA